MPVFLAETVRLSMSPTVAADGLIRYIRAVPAVELAACRAVEDGWTHVSGSTDWRADVTVQHAAPYQRSATAVHPLRWLVGAGDGSPSVLLDANLEVQPTSDGSSALSLLGSFRPSSLGLDSGPVKGEWSEASRVVGRSFLTRIADALDT